jgi:hypothetical protein
MPDLDVDALADRLSGLARELADLQRAVGWRSRAHDTPAIVAAREGLDRLCAEGLLAYVAGSDPDRVRLRTVAAGHFELALALDRQYGAAYRAFEATGDPAEVDRMLVAFAWSDGHPDYRDWLLSLCAVWVAAARRHVDPAPRFAAAARLAGACTEPRLAFDARRTLTDFEHFAVFAEQVVPRLRPPASAS